MRRELFGCDGFLFNRSLREKSLQKQQKVLKGLNTIASFEVEINPSI